MSKKVVFSIVGNGFIAQKHKFFIDLNPQAELASIIDVDGSADYESIQSFVNADQSKTDVVCICSPNALHVRHAVELIQAGYHCVVEKPMALSSEAARLLVKEAEQASKQVYVVMQNRYSPASKWLKSLVENNVLGDIYSVQVNCYWNRDERYYKPNSWHGSKELDGGSIYTQFSHFVDLLYWCFGPLENFSGRMFNFNHQDLIEFEDSGNIYFDFQFGGVGQFNFSTSCYAKNLESSITILAENATLKIGGQYMDQVLHAEFKDPDIRMPERNNSSFGPYKGNASNHRLLIDNVVRSLTLGESPDTSAQEGLAVVEIIEKMYNLAT